MAAFQLNIKAESTKQIHNTMKLIKKRIKYSIVLMFFSTLTVMLPLQILYKNEQIYQLIIMTLVVIMFLIIIIIMVKSTLMGYKFLKLIENFDNFQLNSRTALLIFCLVVNVSLMLAVGFWQVYTSSHILIFQTECNNRLLGYATHIIETYFDFVPMVQGNFIMAVIYYLGADHAKVKP